MVLSGLAFSSWQAWITGAYFVKRPWGLPSPTGFCSHPYVFFALVGNIISYGFWLDCQMKLYPISSQLSLTTKIMTDAVIYLSAIFNLYFRINLYRLHVQLSELLISLEQPRYTPLNSEFRKCWKKHKYSLWVLSLPRYAVSFTLVCAYHNITASFPDSEFFMPRKLYFILFGVFNSFPSVTPVLFAYDLIAITTFHMLWTFEDYCAHLEDHIYKGYFLRRRLSLVPTPSMRSVYIPPGEIGTEGESKSCNNNVHRTLSNEYRNLRRLSDIEGGKGFERLSFNCFVERFDWIQGLAEKYDRVIGPIILGVVVRCVVSFVHSINAIMLKSGEEFPLKTSYHVLLLLIEASQLVILKLGSDIHERISIWKGKLTKAWLLTSSGGNLRGGAGKHGHFLNSTLDSEDLTGAMTDDMEYDNQLVQDLVNYVCTWKWKVSAAGIFDIDKSLLSGIVSTTLTYVIILFQLNLAEWRPESSNETSCSGDSSSSAQLGVSSNSTFNEI